MLAGGAALLGRCLFVGKVPGRRGRQWTPRVGPGSGRYGLVPRPQSLWGVGENRPMLRQEGRPQLVVRNFEGGPGARVFAVSWRKAARRGAPQRSYWNFPSLPHKICKADAMGGLSPPGVQELSRGESDVGRTFRPAPPVCPVRWDHPARRGNFLGLGGVVPPNGANGGSGAKCAPDIALPSG